jgi:hypothetical protein
MRIASLAGARRRINARRELFRTGGVGTLTAYYPGAAMSVYDNGCADR